MKVLVAGFPYVRERFFATFRRWPEEGGISFLLPKVWTAKDGKVVFHPPKDGNVTTTNAYFSHSHYPLIGGLLKGFMPGFVSHLWGHRKNINLVYSCSEPTLLTTLYQALWSKLLGHRHVCFTWENIPYDQKLYGFSKFVHLVILRINLFLSDGIVCGNRAGADILRNYTSKPIAVIPMNGLDPSQFKPNMEVRNHSHLAGKIVYAFIGAISYRKGIHLLIESLPKVLEEVPNAHLIIAGSGEYEGEIKRLIDEPFNRGRITRFPWLDHHEMVRLLSISDVFVYPSIPHHGWAEQFGYSIAEASLMELPVIATRSGSIADVIADRRTGLLVQAGDADELADAMIRLGRDESLRHRLGHAGRKSISEHFSHEIVAHKFYNFFRELARKAPLVV